MTIFHVEYELETIEMAYHEDGSMSPAEDLGVEPTILNVYVMERKYGKSYYDEESLEIESDMIIDLDFPIYLSDLAHDVAALLQVRVDNANELGIPLA